MYSVSQKSLPSKFSDIFPKLLGIFSANFTHLLYIPSYLRSTTNFYLIICHFDEVMSN